VSSVSQNPRPKRPKVASLGTACAACKHSRNWHRHEDDSCSQCDCRQFTAIKTPGGAA
jgi:hypothetical protein